MSGLLASCFFEIFFSPMEFLLVNHQEALPIEFLPSEQFKTTPDPVLNEALRAAEAHRRVRYNLHKILKPGVRLSEIVESVEKTTRILLNGEKNNGIGFPCGVSLNNCAAHYSCNPGDKEIVLSASDVLKIDFGTHSSGRIMDSAFTVCFDPKYETLLRAGKEATSRGLKSIGVDMRVCEIGRDISEVFSSFELEINGRILPIRPVYNLNGHSINPFKIHGGISIPAYNNGDQTKITEGFFAVETFATTGNAEVHDSGDCSHFMLPDHPANNKIYSQKNNKVFQIIKDEFGTLPFSPRHVEYYEKDSLTSIKMLSLRKMLNPYPPLCDVPGSLVAQFEHTVYLKDGKKEIITRGDDY